MPTEVWDEITYPFLLNNWGRVTHICASKFGRHKLWCYGYLRDHSGYGLSQWETAFQCNVVSYWLSLCPERYLLLPASSTSLFTIESSILCLPRRRRKAYYFHSIKRFRRVFATISVIIYFIPQTNAAYFKCCSLLMIYNRHCNSTPNGYTLNYISRCNFYHLIIKITVGYYVNFEVIVKPRSEINSSTLFLWYHWLRQKLSTFQLRVIHTQTHIYIYREREERRERGIERI